jgi:SAM-dependent methyltransferase
VTNGSHAIGSTEAIDAGLVLAKHYTSALLASMELEEYHKMATVEDEMWYYHVLRRHMWSYLKPHLRTEAVKVLDAGCGTGGLIRYLHAKEPTWHLTGVDVSPVACELARRRGCPDVIEADLTQLPLATGAYDAVVSSDVLYHIEDDLLALNELVRVMRPGGVVVINVPAYRWLWSYHDVAVQSQRRYDRWELREKLDTAGLEILKITHWNMLLLPLIVLRRKLLPAPRGGSDVQAYAPWLNSMLKGVMAIETALLTTTGYLPAGSSLLVVARKPV